MHEYVHCIISSWHVGRWSLVNLDCCCMLNTSTGHTSIETVRFNACTRTHALAHTFIIHWLPNMDRKLQIIKETVPILTIFIFRFNCKESWRWICSRIGTRVCFSQRTANTRTYFEFFCCEFFLVLYNYLHVFVQSTTILVQSKEYASHIARKQDYARHDIWPVKHVICRQCNIFRCWFDSCLSTSQPIGYSGTMTIIYRWYKIENTNEKSWEQLVHVNLRSKFNWLLRWRNNSTVYNPLISTIVVLKNRRERKI